MSYALSSSSTLTNWVNKYKAGKLEEVGKSHRELAEHGIHAVVICRQARKFKATMDSSHNLPVAENMLQLNFKVKEPNKAWVSGITYIPTYKGWLYLAGHKDLCTGEVVGYAM